ncbi:hypothetical protein ACFYUD_12970 [Nocardia tengchongensis]|uniref:hypothetical protein n=1 Tax=Nocardia tengchongensis TaxID=2055889 RepID=UPI00361A7830
MRMKYLVGLPVAVISMTPVVASVAAAPAQAAAPTWTCNAQTWGGETLPTLTVEAKKKRQAQGVAQTTWGGVAKFATIDCKPGN